MEPYRPVPHMHSAPRASVAALYAFQRLKWRYQARQGVSQHVQAAAAFPSHAVGSPGLAAAAGIPTMRRTVPSLLVPSV